MIARGCSEARVFGLSAGGWAQGWSPALFVRRWRAVVVRLMAVFSCEPENGQMGQTSGVWCFAGGREIRIRSLELAKFYSSRAYLEPSTGTEVLEQEIGDGARFLKWRNYVPPGGHNISTL